MNDAKPKNRPHWWQIALLILLLPVLLAFLLLVFLFYVIYGACLRIAIWSIWNSRGRDILFVYSDSPIWHEYITANILRCLHERAILLNWSERKKWRLSLATLAFHHFGGGREFNPMAVLFRPCRPTRIFRFWKPFQDFKHGQAEPPTDMQSEFFAALSEKPHSPAK